MYSRGPFCLLLFHRLHEFLFHLKYNFNYYLVFFILLPYLHTRISVRRTTAFALRRLPPHLLRSALDDAGRILLEEPLEYRLPRFELIDMSTIDIILLSNFHSMLSLPYITQRTSFRGLIYGTE